MITYSFVHPNPELFAVGTKTETTDYMLAILELKVPHKILTKYGTDKVEDRVRELFNEAVGHLRREFV